MMEEDRDGRRRARSLAQLERDAALDRVGRTRRGLILATAALTAAFAAVVSAVAPGRTLAAHRQAGSTTPGAAPVRSAPPSITAERMPPLASASDLGLQGPSQAPQPAPDQAPVTPVQPAPDQSQSTPARPAPDQSQPVPQPAPVAAPAPVVSGGS